VPLGELPPDQHGPSAADLSDSKLVP
jgi:hypothetical protein